MHLVQASTQILVRATAFVSWWLSSSVGTPPGFVTDYFFTDRCYCLGLRADFGARDCLGYDTWLPVSRSPWRTVSSSVGVHQVSYCIAYVFILRGVGACITDLQFLLHLSIVILYGGVGDGAVQHWVMAFTWVW